MPEITAIEWDGSQITVTEERTIPFAPVHLGGKLGRWAREKGFTKMYLEAAGYGFGYRPEVHGREWVRVDMEDLRILGPITDIKKHMQTWVNARAIPPGDTRRYPRAEVEVTVPGVR